MADQEPKEPRHSPSSRALSALMPEIIGVLKKHGVHFTDTYRYVRGASIPSAERAALIESAAAAVGAHVPANGWTPDGKGEEGPGPEAPSATEGAA